MSISSRGKESDEFIVHGYGHSLWSANQFASAVRQRNDENSRETPLNRTWEFAFYVYIQVGPFNIGRGRSISEFSLGAVLSR